MNPFQYERASDVSMALTAGARAGAQYLGGGTNLVDLMRETIERPDVLVDVTGLSRDIEETKGGGLKIGGGVKNTAVAADRRVRERFPLLAQAILAGASAQIRNMATVGGNLMQRTRCLYFYDDAARCNKRTPGDGCDARDGFNRNHAVLGASESCVATHPSDMCVALAALDAVVTVKGKNGSRDIPLIAFHRLPGDTPQVDTVLEPGELIIASDLAAERDRRALVLSQGARSRLLRLRPCLGGRGPRDGGGHDQGRAHRARRRGPQAVARRARGSGASGPPGDGGCVSPSSGG